MLSLSPFIKVLMITTVCGTLTSCMNSPAKMDLNSNPMVQADDDMQRVLNAHASLEPKDIETLSEVEARLQPSPADGARIVMKQNGMDPNDTMGVATENIMMDNGITARVYKPENSYGKKLPIVVYYHGGGWVIADLQTYDATPRTMAKQTGAIFISVEYRHAPEDKFPAAHEDAFVAYRWVLEHGERFGGDTNRVAVMGESAGANLAINTAIAARDNGIQMPIYQALIYPVAGIDMNTRSYKENAYAKPLNKAMMGWFVKKTISDESDMNDPRLDLVGKANLKGLPPTTIITAQIDPLRTEGQLLAEKLEESGIKVNVKNYDGVTHEFFGMGAVVAKAKDAEALVAKDLKIAF